MFATVVPNRTPVLVLTLMIVGACSQDEPTSAIDQPDASTRVVDAHISVASDARQQPEDAPIDPAIFSADPPTIRSGETSTLRWNHKDGAYCVIPQGVGRVAINGEYEVRPHRTTTYAFECPGGPGPIAVTTTVVVSDGDDSGPCGPQAGSAYFETARTSVSMAPNADPTLVPIRGSSETTLCGFTCDQTWVTQSLVRVNAAGEAEPVNFPVPFRTDLRMQLSLAAPIAALPATCQLITSGGDPQLTVAMSQ